MERESVREKEQGAPVFLSYKRICDLGAAENGGVSR